MSAPARTTVRPIPADTVSYGVPGWLYMLFFLSGISGLMYEVVWVRMLTRILGSTVYATSTVLAAFMAGLALGSFLIGRILHRARRPLLWYAAVELGIGVSAVLSLAMPERMIPVYRVIYQAAGESRAWLTAGQGGLALVVLLTPTVLMGATLPLLCAFGSRYRESFGQYVGTLYARNTLGAVVGVLASGFILIGAVGETNTILAGVVLNGGVALAALLLGRAPVATAASVEQEPEAVSTYSAGVRRVVIVCFAVSGFVALANEVVWSRMLILHQGTSIYAFSAMLAVMLTGMALGSAFGARRLQQWPDPLVQLARLELLIGVAVAGALYLFDLPLFEQSPAAARLAPVVLVGPLGFLLGVIFPVAARCYLRSRSAGSRGVAELYAWNTIGCIAGAVAGGFVLIPLLGAGRSGMCLAGLSLLVGIVLLAAHPDSLRRRVQLLEWGLLATSCLLLLLVGDPYYRVIERRMGQLYPGLALFSRHIEEAAGTTTAFRPVDGDPRHEHLWVNGRGMTCKTTATKLMAHLPIWLADEPRDVLVICFGMGTTVRSASRHAGLDVTAVELVPGVVRSFGFYHADGPALLRRPNIRAAADDGRNYLLMHDRPYDVITIDPAPPLESAGTVNLYSRSFFELCHQRIRSGGVVCLWVPAASRSEVKLIMRTYVDVFEHVSVWSGPEQEQCPPGVLLLGSRRPLHDVGTKIRRAYGDPAVVADLLEWGREFDRPEKVLGLHVADKQQVRDFVGGVPVISDDRPYTEFPLWRALLNKEDYEQEFSARTLREYQQRLSRAR
ncbi:MAG TPA: fused MFS/spermidine synthase [Gemmataceae bacterium]|jgi:spermidine synthase|nr:fused MFS/spermidine synthase [Gemmataceae bacterium]